MRPTRLIVANRNEGRHGKPIRTKGIEFPLSNINFDPLEIGAATDMRNVGQRWVNRSTTHRSSRNKEQPRH
jgi:hypothetical protein